ncbi:MAG: hypothetical protein KC493_00075 [Bacteriovoracaceae bacterium]|nr:hypothetical protein [Bacteriovoracaceae bacterium]
MTKKNSLLILLLFLTAFTAWFSSDIKQLNPETLFLTKESAGEYLKFKEKFNESDHLVASINFSGDQDAVEKLTSIEKLKESFSSLTFIIPDFNKREIGPKMTLKLIGPNHVGFMAIGKKESGAFKKLITELKNKKGWRLSGLPYTNYMLDSYSKNIQEKLFPFMFILSFILCLLITRNFPASIFIFVPSLFSALFSLASIKLIFGSMNMVTSIVPLLSFSIIFSLGFHLYYSLVEYQDFKTALNRKKKPISLMLFTTSIGFGALLTSKIPVIAHFGILVAGMTFLSAIFSILFFYTGEEVLLKYGIRKWMNVKSLPEKWFSKGSPYSFIIILSALLLGGGSYVYFKLPVLTDATRYFPDDSGVRKEMDWVSQNVAGFPLYNFVLKSNSDETFQKIQKMEVIEGELRSEFDFASNLVSPVSLTRDANLFYSGNHQIPENKFAFFALYSRMPDSLKDSYPLEKDYRMTIMGKSLNVTEYNQNLGRLEKFFKDNGIVYSTNGLYHQLMSSQDEMIKTLFKSFGLSVALVSLLAFFFFKKLRILFIFLLVNTVPVFFSFIFMWLAGLSINIATVMTYSISIGLVVDSSFHVLHSLGEGRTSFKEYVKTTVNPILASSFIFILSFSSFASNDFLPIREFGVILAFILLIGMFMDLFVLPTLFLGDKDIEGRIQ